MHYAPTHTGRKEADSTHGYHWKLWLRSDIGAHQSGMSLSNSKVMMTKASVEPLNCSSWWPAIQCCSCLVRDATWREGFL
ncbi:Septin-8 [Plecturocebus cupreus]